MKRNMLIGKIHRATVTGADLNYEGSITVDETLYKKANMLPYEKVQVLNITNGQRAWTYVIPGPAGQGDIVMNGALARLAEIGDLVIILAYGWMDEDEAVNHKPAFVRVDKNNRMILK
jgi:aspartate 1-decarboxylase